MTAASKTIDAIATDAKAALGDNLVSLVLYGSQARGDAHEQSDINLLIVVKSKATEQLRDLQNIVPKWMKLGALPPVIFAEDQFQRAFDSFALELTEMASARKVLAGSDPFQNFVPDWSAVRRELEHEARQKRIDLHRHWLASGGERKQYGTILANGARGFLVLLRGALVLYHRKLESPKFELVFEQAKVWSWYRPEVWYTMRELSVKPRELSDAEAETLMNGFLDQAFELAKCLDEQQQ